MFAIFSTISWKKGYSPRQLIFGRDMLLLIKHRLDWELIGKKKHTQIDICNARKNKHRVYYDYKFGYKVMLTNHTAYKYKTRYNVPFVITQCCVNGTVLLKYVAKTLLIIFFSVLSHINSILKLKLLIRKI